MKSNCGGAPINKPGVHSTVASELVNEKSPTSVGLDCPQGESSEPIRDNFGPWMIVNKRGSRTSSKGCKGPLTESKGKAHHPDSKSRARFQGESSTSPAPSIIGPLPGNPLPVEKGVAISNPFNSLSYSEVQMASSEEDCKNISDGTTPDVAVLPATLCVQSLQPPLPNSKEPPDPLLTVSEETPSLVPKPFVLNGDPGSEPAPSPNRYDLSVVRSRDRSLSPGRRRLVDRRSPSNSHTRGDEQLRHQDHLGKSKLHKLRGLRSHESEEDLGNS
ncbi:hypothetical protein LOK49_LG13G00062 [Camellia lanceoleosa]|uniref:Uncharacterized protein n=1 Tax=Camellia lanceoleosa TaxID=1840588 RepID=A0ACC0FLS9_9ERIC|nr:hypothetical protein LOK49_LG13G00062 [Camellia lanceoleosa]